MIPAAAVRSSCSFGSGPVAPQHRWRAPASVPPAGRRVRNAAPSLVTWMSQSAGDLPVDQLPVAFTSAGHSQNTPPRNGASSPRCLCWFTTTPFHQAVRATPPSCDQQVTAYVFRPRSTSSDRLSPPPDSCRWSAAPVRIMPVPVASAGLNTGARFHACRSVRPDPSRGWWSPPPRKAGYPAESDSSLVACGGGIDLLCSPPLSRRST